MSESVAASANSPAAKTELPAPRDQLLATFGLVLAAALQAADALIANVALPQLERDLGGGVQLGAWVITSYLCATAVMAPLAGWLRRGVGARHLFPGAVSVFVIASLLCALAPSAAALIVFRILQGAAGGVIHPLAQANLLDIYPQERHGRVMGILGAGVMAGPILGPPLGGFITDMISWRWVFVINLPLGCLSIACVWRLRSAGETNGGTTIDRFGILLLMAGVAALQLFLARGPEQSWFHSPEIIIEAVIAAASFSLMGLRARGTGFATFRPEVLRDINLAAAAFYNFMLSALLFVTVVFVPLMAEGPLGLPATLAGSLIVPRAILLMAVMLFVGRLIGRIDHRALLIGGLLLMSGGLFVLSTVSPSHAEGWIIIGSSIQSAGAGLLYIQLVTLAFSTLPAELRADAAGLYILLRQLGYASGVALMTAVLRLEIAGHRGTDAAMASPVRLLDVASLLGYRDCFRLMAVASLIIIPGIFLFRVAGAAPRRGRAPAR